MARSRTQRQEKYQQFYKSVCTIEVSRARGVESREILANSEGNKKSERVQAKNSGRMEKKERERERRRIWYVGWKGRTSTAEDRRGV